MKKALLALVSIFLVHNLWATDYYLKPGITSNPFGTASNWHTTRSGSGGSDATVAPTSASSHTYIIQGTTNVNGLATGVSAQSVTQSSTVSIAAGVKIEVEGGATLTASSAITFNASAIFQLDPLANYVHSNTSAWASTILQGIENFASNSNFTINATASTGPGTPSGYSGANDFDDGYGNLTLNVSLGSATNCSGALTIIKGNFSYSNSGASAFRFTGNTALTLNVGGNFTVNSGLLEIGNGTSSPIINIGGNLTCSGGTLTHNSTTNTTINFTGGATSVTLSGAGTFTTTRFNFSVANSPTGKSLTLSKAITLATGRTMTVDEGATFSVAGVTYTNSGTTTINGTFRINQGGFASGGTWTYGASAKLIYNHTSGTYGPIDAGHSYWPASNGPRRVEVANKVSGGINMGVARTVADSFITAQQVTGTALLLNGICQLNDGGFFNTAPVYGGSATLVYNTGATTYGRFNELTTGSGIPANITINAGSSLDYGNGATGTARTITGNLTVNGGFFMDFGSNDMTQALTVNGNVSIGTSGTLSLSDAAGGDIKVGGNWTIAGSGAFNPKSRAVFFLNAGTSTITTASPASFDFLIVDKSSGGTVNLANNATVNQTLTLTNGDLVIGANTLTLNAGVARTSGNLRGGITSNLTVNGTAGSLFFTSGGTNNYLRNLTLGTGGTATLGNALNITDYDGSAEGVLTVNSTSGGLTTGGFLTLKSSANGTARVAAGRTSGGYITGDVTVERFIPQNSRKGWRLLASTTSGQTINAAWQEGAIGDGVNPNPGFGTIITGRTSTFGTLSAANAAGYDALSSGHGLLKYNPSTDNLDPVANTNATSIDSEHGYFVFVRGNRQAGSIDVGLPTAPTTSTVLRSKGSLFTGNQSAVSTGSQNWGLVRNPYPSRIDMRNIVRGGSLVDAFQVWDPKVNTVGVYQTFTKNPGTGNYEVTPGGGSYGTIGSVQNFIESGLAFFIQSSGGSGTAQVTEACKTSGSAVAFRPATPQNLGERFYFSLYALNSTGTDMVDGGYVDFDNLYTASVDGYDVRKSPNFGENFGLIRDNVSLVVERRAPINRNDTLFFDMNTLKNISYRIDLSAVNIDPLLTTAFLEDRFTGTSTPVDLTGGITSYTFEASNTAGSKAADRFRLVFRQSTVVPVSIVSVKAIQQNRDIRVEWKVASQVNVARYEVERSTDGRTFTKVAEQTAANTDLYNWLDASVANGTHFYRIRAVDQNGTFRYSSVVKVVVGSGKAGITVSPNPLTGNFVNLQYSNMEAGKYGIRLINMAGQTVYKREMQHAGGSASESFVLPSGVPSGQYQLDVVTPGNLHEVHPVIIQSGL